MPKDGSTLASGTPDISPRTRYRALLIDAQGRILRTKTVLAVSDHDALALARYLVDGRAVELWHQFRFIGRLDPSPT